MYNIIGSIKPYFFSLREIKENVSLDIKIPASWKYDLIPEFNQENLKVALKIQDENERNRLVSLISLANKDGYDSVFIAATKIIKYNQEIEEKNRLFNEKMDELKQIFLETPIEKLKTISFNQNVRTKKGSGEVKNRNRKGSTDHGATQEKND